MKLLWWTGTGQLRPYKHTRQQTTFTRFANFFVQMTFSCLKESWENCPGESNGFIFNFTLLLLQLMTMLFGTHSTTILKRELVQQLLKPGLSQRRSDSTTPCPNPSFYTEMLLTRKLSLYMHGFFSVSCVILNSFKSFCFARFRSHLRWFRPLVSSRNFAVHCFYVWVPVQPVCWYCVGSGTLVRWPSSSGTGQVFF